MKNLLSAARAALSRRRRRTGSPTRRTLAAEKLEDRSLLAAIVMTPQEQLLVELINRARSNPTAEAARFGIDLNQGLSAGSISAAAKQPLAPNQALVNAAAAHSQDMLDNDFFSHTNLSGQSPSTRARAAGYPTGVGENIAWGGSTGSINQNAHVGFRHESLFRSPGHRRNMLSTGYREVGTGVRFGVFSTGGRGYNASMVTEKFGNPGGNYFLTGVAYTDGVVADNFYTIGEEVSTGTVTVTGTGGTFSTEVGPTGGYALQVPNGSYTVTFSGVAGASLVTLAGQNEKLDFVVDPNAPAPSPPPPPANPPADPPANDPPPSNAIIVDDGDAAFQQLGAGWFRGGLAGAYGGDYRFHASGGGSNRAVWNFANLSSGNYEVFATWTPHANRASNAPFAVRDGSALEETVRANQRVAPDDLSVDGRSWESLGIYAIDGGSLSVELSDSANGYVVADAIRVVPTQSAPTNPPANDPPANDPPANDPPANDPPANDPPPANPPASAVTVDDGDAGYAQFGGGWFRGGLAGANGGDYRFHARGSGSNRAVWSFTNVPNAVFDVYATWAAHSNRASDAPFTVRDGSTVEEVVRRSQRTAPDDLVADGTTWERLGTYTIDSGSLTVELTDAANGYVVADAVRLVPSSSTPNDPPANDPPAPDPPPPPPPPPPAPNPPQGTATIVDDGDSGFVQRGGGWIRGGLAGANGGDYRYHAPNRGGSATWSVNNLPAGHYEVFATWMAHANRASDAAYTISDGTSVEEVVRANQRVAPNDLNADGQNWERLGSYDVTNGALVVSLSDAANGYVIADAIRVVPSGAATPPPANPNPPTPTPVDRVLDDGQNGYLEVGGGWITGGLQGANGGDYRYRAAGSGREVARWTFTSLEAGQYEVFASWVAHANRASNAPFTVRDGSSVESTVRVNQRVNPDDENSNGQNWERLGTFQVDSGQLSVELTNAANGYVIADAVRLVRR